MGEPTKFHRETARKLCVHGRHYWAEALRSIVDTGQLDKPDKREKVKAVLIYAADALDKGVAQTEKDNMHQQSDVDIADAGEEYRRCPICERRFVPTSRVNRYCSRRCGQTAGRRKEQLTRGAKKGRPVVPIGSRITCPECGGYETKIRATQIYCSPSCATRAKAKRERERRRRAE